MDSLWELLCMISGHKYDIYVLKKSHGQVDNMGKKCRRCGTLIWFNPYSKVWTEVPYLNMEGFEKTKEEKSIWPDLGLIPVLLLIIWLAYVISNEVW